jgi:hypothetical protein
MTCCRQFAKRLVEQISAAADADADNNVRMKVNGYLMLMGSQIDPTEAVRIANEAIAFTKSKGISHASFLLARLELHLSMSDPEGFRDTMMALERDFGSDPAVMARVQQLLMQLGLVNPDGSPRVGPGGGAPAAAGAAPTEFTPAPAPAESGGGLWTPDQPSTPKPSEGSGGGKLWVPGMD